MSLFILMMVAPIALMVGCGIGAYHVANRNFGMKRNLKQTQRLFKGLTSRGTHASGFAWSTKSGINPNNGKASKHRGFWTLKRPVSGKALAHRMKDLLDSKTQVLLMHTRYPTDGANTAKNAHPHRSPQSGQITLVHNGMVFGHEKVFKTLGVKPETECDSEAIAACLEEGGIKSVVKHCQGSMALLWVDDNKPDVLNAWHNDGNPLYFSRLDNKHGPIVWASTEAHLTKAYGKRLYKVLEATVGKHYTVHPDGRMESTFIEGSYATYYHYTYTRSTGELSNFKTTTTTKTYSKVGHGYDPQTHEGIRPDGTRYAIPPSVDPMLDQLDSIDVKDGEYDPFNYQGLLYSGAHWDGNHWDYN